MLQVGVFATVRTIVDASMTAAAFAREPGERYPAVLATPVMLGEMERAAASLLKPLLTDGQLSVGAKAEVAHFAPTPVGSVLISHARFVGQEGALYWFEVWSEDAGGVVGKGRHGRALVDGENIESRAAARSPTALETRDVQHD